MNTAANVIYEFGPFRIDPDRGAIARDGQPLAITPKVFEVLLTLVRHSREVVPKEDLMQAVWPGRVVEEANLSQCIFVLRKLLGDRREQRRYVVTLPGRGYRFVAAVHCVGPGLASNVAGEHAPPPDAAAVARTPSIAVLPFNHDDSEADQRYFADGLAEGLIAALARFAGLRVISHHSSSQFRGGRTPPAEIARLLGVTHVLEGSVRHHGDAVRITATLVTASDGSVVLSQQYDKPYTSLFALQDALARTIADVLKAKLLVKPDAEAQSDRPPGGNLDAWAAFQRANTYAALATEPGFRSAIAAYRQAIDLDADYAVAHARLCEAYVGLWGTVGGGPASTIEGALADARAAASMALRLAPDASCVRRAHAHLLLANMDWEGARAEATRALQLAPNDPEAQFWLATTLATLGHNRRALDLVRAALAADPRHASWYKWRGVYLAALGQLDAARDAIRTAISLQPGATDFCAQLTLVEILRGDSQAALAAAQRESSDLWRRIALAQALQLGSDRAAADDALREITDRHARDAAYQIAEVHALRHDADQAFTWLVRAWADRDAGMGNLLFDPLLLRYRSDPRFAALCTQVGLPAATDAVAMV